MLSWIHKLKVAHKLMLVSVVFLIPDSVMLCLFITSINETIHAARLEQVGNRYQNACEPLLEMVSEHRLRTEAGGDDPATMRDLRGRIDAAFNELAKVDAKIGPDLQFTPDGLAKRGRERCDVASVTAAWQRLRDGGSDLTAADRDAAHLELIGTIRASIAHAGDNSNLILDPELDSYYLMDVTLLALPQTQERTTQVMIDGLRRIRGEGDPHTAMTTLAIDAARLRADDRDRVAASLAIGLANGNPEYGPNPQLQASVPPLVADYVGKATRFANLVTDLQSPGEPTVTEGELLAAGREASRASFALWAVVDRELDGLLQRRIDHYTYRRARSLAVAACAALAAAMLVMFITRSISGPLKRQAEELRDAVAHAEERLASQQRAEAELRAAQDQLVTASRQAGMAEVATGVLHNVGNVLNSVNVSVHLIKDTVQASQLAKLKRTADLLEGNEANVSAFLTEDERGRRVPGYVVKLARALEAEQASVVKELANLSHGVEHIKQVVHFQQSYAKPSTLFETLDPAALFEDALRLNLIALDRHGVTVTREFADVGPVRMDKHKTLQVLVNLISNAKNAMSDLNANHERKLTLRIESKPLADGLRLRMSVGDNGVGIPPENLTRIFAHGFTTRKEGHGFGLHSAANAAREMGGSVQVSSDGPGRGATFTLDLPVTSGEATNTRNEMAVAA